MSFQKRRLSWNCPRGENGLTTNNLRAISMKLHSPGAQAFTRRVLALQPFSKQAVIIPPDEPANTGHWRVKKKPHLSLIVTSLSSPVVLRLCCFSQCSYSGPFATSSSKSHWEFHGADSTHYCFLKFGVIMLLSVGWHVSLDSRQTRSLEITCYDVLYDFSYNKHFRRMWNFLALQQYVMRKKHVKKNLNLWN